MATQFLFRKKRGRQTRKLLMKYWDCVTMCQHILLVALLEPVTHIEWQWKECMKSHKRRWHLIKALILSDANLLLPSRAFSYRASSKQLHTYRLHSSHHRNLGLLTGTDSTDGSFISLSIWLGMFRVQLRWHPSKKSTVMHCGYLGVVCTSKRNAVRNTTPRPPTYGSRARMKAARLFLNFAKPVQLMYKNKWRKKRTAVGSYVVPSFWGSIPNLCCGHLQFQNALGKPGIGRSATENHPIWTCLFGSILKRCK